MIELHFLMLLRGSNPVKLCTIVIIIKLLILLSITTEPVIFIF